LKKQTKLPAGLAPAHGLTLAKCVMDHNELILRNGETKVQQKTYYPKAAEIQRDWVVINAEGQTLGRLAARIARVLLGKHKPSFTPGVEMGDFVVVTNAERVTVTGTKTHSKFEIKDVLQPFGLSRRLEDHHLCATSSPPILTAPCATLCGACCRTTAWDVPCSSA
jgi:ribosomal protein L13